MGCLLGVSVLLGRTRPGHTGDAQDGGLDMFIARMQQTYERTHALTAEFVQVATLTSINRQQTSSGYVHIQKPHAIRWEYTQPDAQTILYDGSTLRIYTPKRRQLLQSPVNEDNRANVALLFLAGVGNLRETFVVSFLSHTDPQLTYLQLQPRSQQAAFTELHLAVNPQSYFVEKLLIHDNIGNLTEIRLSSLRVHSGLPAKTFELVVPPETETLTPSELSGGRK